jgi:hypothetical protein
MKSAGISELKKELRELPASDLVELCLTLAKFKKDKELDENFVDFQSLGNLYYVKKGLRRVLRLLNKYNKYLNDKAVAADLNIYFCMKLKDSGIPFQKNKLIVNLYEQQLKKINALIAALHEDLRGDYQQDLEKITRY